ncbi:MAG: hypothetical protein ACXU7Z_16705 [Burkholderiaceae bacterium]
MIDKSMGILLIALIIVQGIVSLVIMYGLNGGYIKKHKNMWRAMRYLYDEKPVAAIIASVCWWGMYVELLFAFLIKAGKH